VLFHDVLSRTNIAGFLVCQVALAVFAHDRAPPRTKEKSEGLPL
jgi:hypothetical protein